MTVIHYWQQLSKRLIIKTALSHLLLGVIAAGFSLSEQNALPVQITQQVSIIAIATIVQEHQTAIQTQSQTLSRSLHNFDVNDVLSPVYSHIAPGKVVRLSPHNGIRAGPVTTSLLV